MRNILVLHGPSLNLLGVREPSLYGSVTLNKLNAQLKEKALQASLTLEALQSNSESELIEIIHQTLQDPVDYLIFNPAAFTHTSIALRDALLAVNMRFIEVHISNIYDREPFRRYSYFSDIAQGVISGLGICGYHLALQTIIDVLTKERIN